MSIESFVGFMTMMFNKKEVAEEPEDCEPNAKFIRQTFRPTTFKEYVNDSNKQAVTVLKDAIKACKMKNKTLPHVLLFGPAGTGKTTLSKICAYEYGGNVEFIETIGSAFKRPEDIVNVLMKVWDAQYNDRKVIVFIDEVHELGKSKLPDTLWYTILEDFVLHHTFDGKIFNNIELEGNTLNLEPFTMIGATTDPALIKKPLRDRFGIHCTLKPYSISDIRKVIKLSAEKRDYKITPNAITEIANRSRGNPRISISYLESSENKRIVKRRKTIDKEITTFIFNDLRINSIGLFENDISILIALKEHSKGLGMKTLGGMLEIDEVTLRDMYLSHLYRIGFVMITHKHFITKEGLEFLRETGD